MDEAKLRGEVRELIDKKTLEAGMGELDACLLAESVLSELANEYDMRAGELQDEEE